MAGFGEYFVKPLTVSGDRITDDSSAKTVHVGNLDPCTKEEELIELFSPCGPISFVRILGDEGPNRYAFVEFLEVGGCSAAFHLAGAILHDRPIKVNRSHSGMVKPHTPANLAVKARIKAVLERISKKVLEEEANDSRPDRDRKRLRSPSRSLERGKKPRSRSRDRHY
eukprot:NODE_5465_length_650_cov_50.479924_g5301_i0.p1 GENE.NODE_5465_length_650_cov_50.479924_g5301_i0~~NODE_5465_length_650_cov_50.479924_g5301_i0.p1  ORF type:complete len:168 (+),score=37.08 NODE_5465_length_650_cov_50.479924_g5301_i0:49-552(+)